VDGPALSRRQAFHDLARVFGVPAPKTLADHETRPAMIRRIPYAGSCIPNPKCLTRPARRPAGWSSSGWPSC